MATYRIRETADTDLGCVTSLLSKSYSALLAQAYSQEMLEKALPLITKAQPDLLTSGTYYAAMTSTGEIVGVGGWTNHSPTCLNDTAENGNIRHFGTYPEHTGKGIGRALMERCVKDAVDAGLKELNCYSTLNGEAFYRNCGFQVIEPFSIALPGGVDFPAIRMVRQL